MDTENIIASLRAALATDATPESRAAGATALGTGTSRAPTASIDASAVARVISTFRGVPPDQLLDLAITKLRATLPDAAEAPRTKPLSFHLVPIPGAVR